MLGFLTVTAGLLIAGLPLEGPLAELGLTATTEALPDGMTLVHLQLPEAERAALRYVVHSGGSDDPKHVAGLAHLSGHALLQVGYFSDRAKLMSAVRSAGGDLGLDVHSSHTVFRLDGPTSAFEPSVRRLLGLLGNPAFPVMALGQERRPGDLEGFLRGVKDFGWTVDQFLHSKRPPESIRVGPGRWRPAIRLDQVYKFFQDHYAPANTSVIYVGTSSAGAVRSTIEKNTLLAPGPEPERSEAETHAPVEAEAEAPMTVLVYGYVLQGKRQHACPALADLVGLRLYEELVVDAALSAEVDVGCIRLRDQRLLVAIAHGDPTNPDALESGVAAVFRGVVSRPISFGERKALQLRRKLELRDGARDVSQLADLLAHRVAFDRGEEIDQIVVRALTIPPFSSSTLARLARVSFRSQQLVRIRLGFSASPAEADAP